MSRHIGGDGRGLKSPNINHIATGMLLAFRSAANETSRVRAMEALKIYLMMALITAIVAVSYRKTARANPEQSN